MFLYDGTEVTVTYETSENAGGGGGGCSVAGYAFALWLVLIFIVSKRNEIYRQST